MLELSIAKWPEENANFPHVSGLMFCVNTMADEGAKVYNVHIMNRETGSYEELALDEMYTVASSSFILLECGDGMTMFEGAEVVSDTGILDIEIVEKYLTANLGGVLDESYARVSLHITYTEGYLDNPYAEDSGHAIVIGVVGLILAVATIVTVLIIRKKRKG